MKDENDGGSVATLDNGFSDGDGHEAGRCHLSYQPVQMGPGFPKLHQRIVQTPKLGGDIFAKASSAGTMDMLVVGLAP